MAARRRRVLIAGHITVAQPLPTVDEAKWAAVEKVVDFRLVAAGGDRQYEDPRFRLIRLRVPRRLRGPLFYCVLPAVISREAKRFRPHVIVARSPYEGLCALAGRALARSTAKVVVEVHGDWRTAARLYGSRWRRVYAWASDRAAVLALRRADGTRALSNYTADLAQEITGRPPLAVFPTFFDAASFFRKPPCSMPESPVAVWIGVFERYKNLEGFVQAWREAARRVPTAKLVVIGQGHLQHLVDELSQELSGRVSIHHSLSPREVARELDRATFLVLPSRSEGMGRVIIEAFARGRPVIASRVGGIPDLVEHQRNGLLVEARDTDSLTAELTRLLTDNDLARRLGIAAREDAEKLRMTSEQYAESFGALVAAVTGGASRTLPSRGRSAG